MCGGSRTLPGLTQVVFKYPTSWLGFKESYTDVNVPSEISPLIQSYSRDLTRMK